MYGTVLTSGVAFPQLFLTQPEWEGCTAQRLHQVTLDGLNTGMEKSPWFSPAAVSAGFNVGSVVVSNAPVLQVDLKAKPLLLCAVPLASHELQASGSTDICWAGFKGARASSPS